MYIFVKDNQIVSALENIDEDQYPNVEFYKITNFNTDMVGSRFIRLNGSEAEYEQSPEPKNEYTLKNGQWEHVFTNEQQWDVIRRHRNQLLQASDWTQIPDNELTPEQQTAWKTWRSELRALPQTYNNDLDGARNRLQYLIENQPT